MNNFNFYSPTKVVFGKDAEMHVAEEIKAFGGTKVLIHYGGGSVIKSGLLDRVKKVLTEAGLPFVELGGAKPNPRLSLAHEGIELCRKEGVDFVLAVGGGSAIDSAKCIALGVPYEGEVWDIWANKVKPQKGIPHGNIITLAASGTETSEASVITNDCDGKMIKTGYSHPLNRAKFALMNPELLYTLPPFQTACGVVDVMSHTHERFFSSNGESNYLTDKIALDVIKTAVKYGPTCMSDPTNYQARSEVMWAGSLSHNTLTGLGRKGDWATHQLEHAVGGIYDIAHGAGLSALWATWARYVYKENPMRFAQYGVEIWDLDMNYDNPEETALEAIAAAENFFKQLGMPTSLTEVLGKRLTDEECRFVAHTCSFFGTRTIGNFKVLTEDDMYNIYCAAR